MNAIQLIARTDETVTLRASDHDAPISAVEDAEDIAGLLAAGAREDVLGKLQARADRLPVTLVERLLDGENPTRIWREHRGLSPQALAHAAGLSEDDLADLDAGRCEGSVAVHRSLATALGVPVDDLIATTPAA